MPIVYPLSFPSISVVSSTFRLVPVIGESTSVFTGAQQLYRHPGEWWEGEVTFRTTKHSEAGQLKAFLASLRGKYGTFLYGDPDYLAKGKNGTITGTPLANGINAAGSNSINIKGLTALTDNFEKGDYIQLGTGSSSRMYMIVEDVTADAGGNCEALIEPRLRTATADGDVITHVAPKTVMRLLQNPVEWQADQNSLYQVTIAFREAISI